MSDDDGIRRGVRAKLPAVSRKGIDLLLAEGSNYQLIMLRDALIYMVHYLTPGSDEYTFTRETIDRLNFRICYQRRRK